MGRLHREAMGILIAEIVGGRYAVGERMLPEHHLSSEFGVSRGTVREAIRGLEERGLVSVRHGHGAIVTSSETWNILDADVLRALLRTRDGASALQEFLECRRILETQAAALAATRASAEDLSTMADILERMNGLATRAVTNPGAEDLYHEADIDFHRAIIMATGNRAIARLIDPVRDALLAARRPTAHPESRLERTLPEHREIFVAIADHDAEEARAAMARHLETIGGYLYEYAQHVREGDSVHWLDASR